MRTGIAIVIALLTRGVCLGGEPSAVVVYNERFAPPECVAAERLHELTTALVSGVWTWSSETPARRSDLAGALQRHAAAGTKWLSVRVDAGSTPSRRGSYVIRAAPVAMWEEVPEDLLPSVIVKVPMKGDTIVRVPVDAAVAWRVRAIGAGAGSWWVDVPPGRSSISVTPIAATDSRLHIQSENGERLGRVRLSLLDEGAERGDFRKLVDYRTDDRGEIVLRRIPDISSTTLLFAAPERVPLAIEAKPSHIPHLVTLRPGSKVVGRLLDGRGRPVTDAVVTIRTWASELVPVPLIRVSTSKPDGEWKVTALPEGRAECVVSAAGFVDVVKPIDITGTLTDLGTILVERAVTVDVVVSDDRGDPVSGAELTIASKVAATTDRNGRASLKLSSREPVDVQFSAAHHVSMSATLKGSTSGLVKIVLRRGFRITGRFVDSQHAPISPGRIRTRVRSQFSMKPLEPSGQFDLDLEPGSVHQIEILSPVAAAVRLDVEKGSPGEVRDLGDVVAPAALVVTGRVVRQDGSPIAGARVWLPRPSENGPLMAWAFRDLLETTTAGDGTFALTGVPHAPCLVRVEAPAFASGRRALTPDVGADHVDVGDVTLTNGSKIVMRLDGDDGHDAVAHVDPGGYGLSIDLLTAPFLDGKATIENVPGGAVAVSAWRGRDMLCRQQLQLTTADDDPLEIACSTRTVLVSGRVTVGGGQAGSGTLVWISPGPSDVPTGIFTFGSGAAQQQHVFSPESPRQTAGVAPDGNFEGPRLLPGIWNVLWMPDESRVLGPRQVTIPDVAVYALTLDYPGVSVEGVVVDEERKPVKAAEVREIGGRGFAITRDDGSFTIAGPEAGTWRLRAQSGGRASDIVDVITTATDGEPRRVELVLKDAENIVHVAVGSSEGPASGAMVFLEGDRGLQLATADQTGTAAFRFIPPFPSQVRVAASVAGGWAFGEWIPWTDAVKSAIHLIPGAAGAVILRSKGPAGPVSILSQNGWQIDRLFQWLGIFLRVAPDADVPLNGLPVGAYVFRLENEQRPMSVESHKTAEVVFD